MNFEAKMMCKTFHALRVNCRKAPGEEQNTKKCKYELNEKKKFLGR